MFKHEKADKLLAPERQKKIPIDKVLTLLALDEDDVVADLGCGNGYATLPIAKKVKTNVKAVDIQPEMLALLKERATAATINNIDYIESPLDDLHLEEKSLDKVIIAFVLHEVPNIVKVFDDLQSILKEDGKLLILEWEAVASEEGPPLHHRLPSNQLATQLEKHGFQTELGHFNDDVYYIVAKK